MKKLTNRRHQIQGVILSDGVIRLKARAFIEVEDYRVIAETYNLQKLGKLLITGVTAPIETVSKPIEKEKKQIKKRARRS